MRRLLALVVATASLAACDQIFGIDPGDLVVSPDAAGNDASSDVAVDVAPIGDAGDAAPVAAPYWMFTTTDFQSKAEVVLLTPPSTLLGRFTLPTGDALASANLGRAFVLNRTTGEVFLLDGQSPGSLSGITKIQSTIGVDGGSGLSNPYAAIMVSSTKAYIVRYDSNSVLVVDVTKANDAGVIPAQAEIDLSAFVGTQEVMGVVDMAAGVYVLAQQRAYIALERINRTLLTTDGALVVAIDTTTDKVYDRNDSGTIDLGDAITLPNQNPLAITLDEAGNRLLVVENGANADGGFGRSGVDAIDLTSLAATAILNDVSATTDTSSVASLLYVNSSTAFSLSYLGACNAWDPSTSTMLGGLVTFVPSIAPFVDTTGLLVGVSDDVPADAATPVWGVHSVQDDGNIAAEPYPNLFTTVLGSESYSIYAVLVH